TARDTQLGGRRHLGGQAEHVTGSPSSRPDAPAPSQLHSDGERRRLAGPEPRAHALPVQATVNPPEEPVAGQAAHRGLDGRGRASEVTGPEERARIGGLDALPDHGAGRHARKQYQEAGLLPPAPRRTRPHFEFSPTLSAPLSGGYLKAADSAISA